MKVSDTMFNTLVNESIDTLFNESINMLFNESIDTLFITLSIVTLFITLVNDSNDTLFITLLYGTMLYAAYEEWLYAVMNMEPHIYTQHQRPNT